MLLRNTVTAALLFGGSWISSSTAQEFRALWADTFHAGLRNGGETTALVAAARQAHCNAIVVEVRKRGDAYYRNGLEPVASDVAAGFDPLADLIQKAHSGSPRVEVHAWLVTYNIWNSEFSVPADPSHPFNLHPDWVTENNLGEQWDGGNYQFDPGHPAVQSHTFQVAMDILTRYDIDGLHLDYVRYSENGSTINNQPWGYNPVTVARFKKLKSRTSTPSPTDSVWLQWRREQVTALVRKLYLNAWAAKPHVRISAALIPWGTAPADLSLAAWQGTNAYARVLQDWRGWMEEGILDLACPMVYRTDNPGFTAWATFTKDRQYNRAGALGMGWYLNSVGNTIAQIKLARTATAGGKTAAGILGYSYAVPNRDKISGSETWNAFTNEGAAETYDPGGSPVFAENVLTPPMPWKTNTTRGHIMGTVRENADGAALDGLTLTLTGPISRTVVSDATGFFGSVDLPVGAYRVTATLPGYRSISRTVSVTGAAVAQPILTFERVPLQITALSRNAATNTLSMTWASIPGRTYRVEISNDQQTWTPVANEIVALATSTTSSCQVPASWTAQAFLRVAER